MYILILPILIILCIIYYMIFKYSKQLYSKQLYSNSYIKPCSKYFSNPDDIYSIKKYLINLEHRKDRLKVTTKLLNDNGFKDIIRYPAVNGKQLNNKEIKELVLPRAMKSIINEYRTEHHELSLGAVGCSLSHINIWKEFNDSTTENSDMVLIFEDDTLPSFNIDQLKEYLENVPADWDILLLGGIYFEREYVNHIVEKINKFFCMHGYLIRKKCLPFLIENAFPLEKQIDSWLSDLSRDDKIKIYGIRDNIWIQNHEVNSTDIQTPIDILD